MTHEPSDTYDTQRYPATAVAAIVFAIAFNAAFYLLSLLFDYPDILRQPPAGVLSRFHAGGTGLILAWLLFAAIALAHVPFAAALSRIPGAGGAPAALLGGAAGLAQAMGLVRWVFAVPGLASIVADPVSTDVQKETAIIVFQALHQYAGVGIGEQIGQALTAFWAIGVGVAQWRSARFGPIAAALAFLAAALILMGLIEGAATVMAFDPGLLAMATPIGYVALSIWLIATGIGAARLAR